MFFSNTRLHMQNHPNPTTNQYQFCTENNVITTAFGQLLSNPTEENKVSIASPPKNVKFIIPVSRSGVTSNESTFNAVDSTTRTITHVKDIFPLNFSLSQSQTTLVDTNMKNDSEEIPLLPIENSNEQNK